MFDQNRNQRQVVKTESRAVWNNKTICAGWMRY